MAATNNPIYRFYETGVRETPMSDSTSDPLFSYICKRCVTLKRLWKNEPVKITTPRGNTSNLIKHLKIESTS
jgi:hypothetical protein